MNIKRQLIIPFTLIGLLILIPTYSLLVSYFKSASSLSLKSTLTEVNLFSHHGKIVNIKDFKDTPTLLFFGFTHCPEVCPTTLSNLLNNIELLEKNKKNYKVLFVTLDPERDTINNLNNYLQNFNSSVIGLTGEIDEINKFAKNWNIYWEKVSEGDSYTINHTATVFMINKKGNFAGTIAWGESDKSIKLKLQKLLNL
ncbi:MAG: SCO family protein [Alphaproteobacteria bacterium]|nr:MAG: SCO family protein [Alphaproteobacteria bacterium]